MEFQNEKPGLVDPGFLESFYEEMLLRDSVDSLFLNI